MQIVNMHEAKTQLSRLVEAAVGGEDVVIARAGTPVARIVPVTPERPHLMDELGALGKGRSKAEVDRIVAALEAPWSKADDFLEATMADDPDIGERSPA